MQTERASSIGICIMLTRGLMNLSEKEGGLRPASVVQDPETILEDCERVFNAHNQSKANAMIQIAITPALFFQ